LNTTDEPIWMSICVGVVDMPVISLKP